MGRINLISTLFIIPAKGFTIRKYRFDAGFKSSITSSPTERRNWQIGSLNKKSPFGWLPKGLYSLNTIKRLNLWLLAIAGWCVFTHHTTHHHFFRYCNHYFYYFISSLLLLAS